MKMPIIERGMAFHIDNCPIQARVWKGKYYANFYDDCAHCEHLADYQIDDNWGSA